MSLLARWLEQDRAALRSARGTIVRLDQELELAREHADVETARLALLTDRAIAAEERGERLAAELHTERAAMNSERGAYLQMVRHFTAERASSVAAIAAMGRAFAERLTRLVTQIVELRRDGFNPLEPSLSPPLTAGDRLGAELATAQRHERELRPVSEDERRGWLKVVEAIQERSSGDKDLAGRMSEDCHRWRALGIPLEQIAKRVYDGWEG